MSALITCHILIGTPGCGKSTFAMRLAQLYPTARIISTDQIRRELFGDESMQGNWLMIQEKVLKQMQEAMQAGQSIIYDATNAKKAWRVSLINQIVDLSSKENKIQCIGWYLQTPLEVCQVWNKKRSRQVPDIVIEDLFQALQDNPPDESEGFVEVNYVDVSNKL